jgi:hypothetical protein
VGAAGVVAMRYSVYVMTAAQFECARSPLSPIVYSRQHEEPKGQETHNLGRIVESPLHGSLTARNFNELPSCARFFL